MENNFGRNNEVAFFTNILNSNELYLCECGDEKCPPDKQNGPLLIEHFQLYYIYEGEGVLYTSDREFKLEEGQGFLIFPNEVCFYKACGTKPWGLLRVGFKGYKAEYYMQIAGLSLSKPVFTYQKGNLLREYLKRIVSESNKASFKKYFYLQTLLYSIINQVIQNSSYEIREYLKTNIEDEYISKAIEYIATNYSSNDLSVSKLVQYLSVNNAYFNNVFKSKLGVSPGQYLIKFRIDKACELLKHRNYSIGDVARYVGYADQMTFSKIFKKVVGYTPTEYRKRIKHKLLLIPEKQ